MGQFSWICKECDKQIKIGDHVQLTLIEKGKTKEVLKGYYDGYGRAGGEFKTNWDKVVDLMFDDDKSNGVIAVHFNCKSNKKFRTRSKDDPNQGW